MSDGKQSTPRRGKVVAALVKETRDNCKRIRALSLKPANVKRDEDNPEAVSFECVYVSKTGAEMHVPCEKSVWQKIDGGKQLPGQPHQGLDMKTDKDFDILVRDGIVVDIDVMPKAEYIRGLIPEGLKDVRGVIVRVDTHTGGLTVTQLPPKLPEDAVARLLHALDAVSEINPDDVIAGFLVKSVSGSEVTFMPTAA